jgi:hypothetical protein
MMFAGIQKFIWMPAFLNEKAPVGYGGFGRRDLLRSLKLD